LKTTRGKRSAQSRELASLREHLAEAEDTLRAIRSGEVDAVVVAGKHGKQVFTLEGAEHDYRVLIESMNEGALTLTAGKGILYANQCFARMVKCPLEQVMGGSFRRFLSAEDRTTLRLLLKRAGKPGSKVQVLFNACDGSQMPVQISIRPLARSGADRATIGMVVTDLTAARRNEEMLRAFSRRLVQVQEAERGRVALDLHDNITQHLCAVVFRSQALADKLSARDGPSKGEALKLRKMLGATVREVERISGNLRSSVLDQLGLVAALQKTGEEFADRTGVSVKLACVEPAARLPIGTELALFRLLQEALKNAEKHAHARHISVSLKDRRTFVQLVIHDDGIGFDADHYAARRKGALGLLSMRERAASVGGSLRIKSGRRAGTEIEVCVPQQSPQGGRVAGTNN
jgi:PAS domain S-box-containing protein